MNMRRKNTILTLLINAVLIINMLTVNAFAAEPPDIKAKSGILIEREMGKVLYEKNADLKVYPASITKVLTAILFVENIPLDEIIVMGNEVNSVPWDSSKAGHLPGESILAENLLRALLIPSGNESACVAASAVAKKITKNPNMPYEEAEPFFADLMNKKANELGATHSNFKNPHGYHDDDHYTSARDIAIICRAAMEHEAIAKTVKELEYKGNGAGNKKTGDMKTAEYDWKTTNLLLMDYPYADGIKTGFTNQAGYCLSASAAKDGEKLIAIVFGEEEEKERWADTLDLFDYGFDNYDYETIQQKDAVLEAAELYDPKLGESKTMDMLGEDEFIGYFSKEELSRIEKEIIYKEHKIAIPEKNEEKDNEEEASESKIKLLLPIKEGDVLGTISYKLDNEVIFKGNIIASRDAEERTFKTDVQYYYRLFIDNAFTLKAIPGWIMIIAVLFLIISFFRGIRRRRRRRDLYTLRRRY